MQTQANPVRIPGRKRGITLVEVLIVVAIMAVLALIVVAVTRNFAAKAKNLTRLSNVRQAGTALLANATEKNGRCEFFSGGATGAGMDLRPYNIVRDALNIPRDANNEGLCAIMHWDPATLPPNVLHWNCYAVNFQKVEEIGAVWKQESLPYQGGVFHVKTLRVGSLSRPDAYPLLIDSSASNGAEIFRILESSNNLVGLRYNGKANAFFFDGSAKTMDKAALKKAGFTKAYDNSTSPPELVTF